MIISIRCALVETGAILIYKSIYKGKPDLTKHLQIRMGVIYIKFVALTIHYK